MSLTSICILAFGAIDGCHGVWSFLHRFRKSIRFSFVTKLASFSCFLRANFRRNWLVWVLNSRNIHCSKGRKDSFLKQLHHWFIRLAFWASSLVFFSARSGQEGYCEDWLPPYLHWCFSPILSSVITVFWLATGNYWISRLQPIYIHLQSWFTLSVPTHKVACGGLCSEFYAYAVLLFSDSNVQHSLFCVRKNSDSWLNLHECMLRLEAWLLISIWQEWILSRWTKRTSRVFWETSTLQSTNWHSRLAMCRYHDDESTWRDEIDDCNFNM